MVKLDKWYLDLPIVQDPLIQQQIHLFSGQHSLQ